MIKFRQTHQSAEPILFCIGKGKLKAFLSGRGFKIIQHLTADDMGKKYLTLSDGSTAGKVTALFCLAQAEVSN